MESSRRTRRGERGSILLLSLLVLTLIIVFVADSTQVSLVEFETSLGVANRVKLEAGLQYGFELARAHLRQDLVDSEIDSLAEEWNTPLEVSLDDPNTRAEGAPREVSTRAVANADGRTTDAVKLVIEIEDEERKWPLGLLVVGTEAQQNRRRQGLAGVIDAFREQTVADVDAGTADRMAELIASFLARREGDLTGPVPRPNTKSPLHIFNVADLSLVPEIPDAIMYDQVDEQGNVLPGLTRFLTLHGELAINVNTAPLAVLRGLFRPDDRIIADNVLYYRSQKDAEAAKDEGSLGSRLGGSEDRGGRGSDGVNGDGTRKDGDSGEDDPGGAIFQKPEDVKKVTGYSETAWRETQNVVATNSTAFSIWVTATLGTSRLQRHWIVRRTAEAGHLVFSERIDPDYRPRFRLKEEEGAEGQERRKLAAERTRERREGR